MAQPRLDALEGYEPEVAIPRVIHGWGNRIGHSDGGVDGVATIQQAYSHPFHQDNRQPNYTNADLITYTRQYIYRRAYAIPPALDPGHVSWLDSGPTKDMPTTRFNRNVRPLVGGSHQDMWGYHTNVNADRGNALDGKPRMRAAKQNRLTVQRYRGQSYSQTTEVVR